MLVVDTNILVYTAAAKCRHGGEFLPAVNFRKHGVTFEQATYAFRDPFGVEWVDERADYGEERVILLGMSGGQILSVVYAERGERIRIISARRATKYEKDTYYRQNAT